MSNGVAQYLQVSSSLQNTQAERIAREKARLAKEAAKVSSKNLTGIAGLWTGAVSSDWGNPNNWDDLNVPFATDNVNIPFGTPHDPVITSGNTYCSSLYLQSGATLTQNAGTTLVCWGTFDAGFGQFTMQGGSYLSFAGSTGGSWWDDNQNDTYSNVTIGKSSNTSVILMQNNMTSTHNFYISKGVLQMAAYKSLTVTYNALNAFRIGNGGKLILTATNTIDIAGMVTFEPGSQLDMSGGFIKTSGDFYTSNDPLNDIQMTGGWLYMQGNNVSQKIRIHDAGTQLFNVKINKPSGVCYIEGGNLDINGSLVIDSGTLSCHEYSGSTTFSTINIAGDWTNNVGDAGFDQATGRVVFDGGNYHQYCSNETFNELEINKPSGGAFRVNGTTVLCAAYDWTAGAIDVLSGSFTASDLIDNGIYGVYYLNTGGTINLSNTDGYVDLDGDLNIFGGTMNIYGGTYESYWPYQANASITMSDGVLDFHDRGIYIFNSSTFTLTENITGGTIRTSQGFSGNRADFTPTAGTFEFYGSGNYFLSQSNGCTLFDVNINKTTVKGNSTKTNQSLIDERSGLPLGPGGITSTNSLSSNFVITNNLNITSGELKLNGHSLNVTYSIYVYGTLTLDNPADVLTSGSTHFDFVSFYSGSMGNFSNGVANIYGWLAPYAGCSFTASTNNTIYFTGIYGGGGPSNHEPTATYGNIVIDKNASATTYIDAGATEPIVVNGTFTINPNNKFKMQAKSMIVHGAFTDNSSSEFSVSDIAKSKGIGLGTMGSSGPGNTKTLGGSLTLDSDVTLNGWMYVGAGDVLAHGLFNEAATGSININGGSLVCDVPSGIHTWYGLFSLSGGLIEYSTSSIRYYGAYGASNITAGTIRAGRSMIASDGALQDAGGTFEFVGNTNGNYLQLGNNCYLNNFLFNRTGNYVVYPANTAPELRIYGNVDINSGTFSSNGNDLAVGGNWTNNAGTSGFDETTGNVSFIFANATISPGETFYNLTLNKGSSADWLTLSGDVTVLNNLNELVGSLHTGANILDVKGNVDIASSTILSVEPGGTLKIGDNKALTTALNSFLDIEGTAGNQAILTHSGAGRYACNIYGQIAADYATFEFMDVNGVYMHGGSTVNPSASFNHCIFRNGSPTPSASLLSSSSSDTFTSTGTYFENTSGNTAYNVWKISSSGDITFNNASGDFAGPEFEFDPYNHVHWGPVDVDLSLTAMLEGPYNGTDMNTDLNTSGLIPLNQPFNSNPLAAWYYPGTESVSSIPPNVVDWVLVIIKDAADAASSAGAPVVAEQAAFILNDGRIVDLDGTSNLLFPTVSYSSGLYPIVWHRNHLGVISANRMTKTLGIYTYDFTTAGSAYGNTFAGEKDLGGGVYGLWGGDGNGTGLVADFGDDIFWWRIQAGKSMGYFETDYNMDTEVDNTDKNDVFFDSNNINTQIPGSKKSLGGETK